MKVCIFGAGAVGGHIATRLLAAKADDISVVARGAQLQAMRTRGLTLRTGGKEIHAKPAVATDDASTLPPQDVIAYAAHLLNIAPPPEVPWVWRNAMQCAVRLWL